MSERAERILVRCPNWLGDVVMATAGLRALRAARPNAWIVGHLPPALIPLLEGGAVFDELWPVVSRGGGWGGYRADVKRIAEGRFDLGIAVPESISSAALMRIGGVRRVVGFARDPLRRALLHEALPAPEAWGRRRLVSKERFVLALIAGATRSPESTDTRLDLCVSAEEASRLKRTFPASGTREASAEGSSWVVLAPGAGFGDSKCWPTESFAALADRLATAGHRVILLGGPGESERLAAVKHRMEREAWVLDGVLDLGALKALLAEAALLVANDAGARHIAAAFGVPSVVFFGPTSVEKTSDNLEAIEVLEGDHACRPCYRRRCPIDHRCLREISVDAALAASRHALANDPRRDVSVPSPLASAATSSVEVPA